MWNKLRSENNIYLIIGHVFFLTYLLGTGYYYAERLFNNDAAYYTFHVINYEEFFVKHQRYISYFTQWAPILLAKLGFGLKPVLIAYSAMFGAWFYGIYLIVAHVFKAPKEGVFLALALATMMRYKHFAGHTEITFALVVASALIAWMVCDKEKIKWYSRKTDWIVKVVFIAWLYIIHPIIIVPLMVVITAIFFHEKRWKDVNFYGFVGLLCASFVLRFLTVAKDSYESGKIGILSSASEVFGNPEEFHVFHIIQRYLDKDFHIPILIFAGCLVALALRKKVWEALSLLGGFLAIGMLVIVTYSYLRGNIYIMIDGYLGMLGMPVAFAIYLVIKEDIAGKFMPYLVSLLLLFSLVKIQGKSKFMKQRLVYYKETFALHPENRKMYGRLDRHHWDKLWYPYEVPIETLMLSALDGKENCRTIYIDYDQKGPEKLIEGNDYFLIFDHKMGISDLNQKYFSLPEDVPYKEIKKVAWK